MENLPNSPRVISKTEVISDSLVALGTEAAIEGILSSFSQNQQQNEANGLTEGVDNGETTEG